MKKIKDIDCVKMTGEIRDNLYKKRRLKVWMNLLICLP
jgi:hypothetical protein